MSLSLCSIVSEVIPSCSNEYCQKEPVVAQRVLFLQEERQHHAKRNERHESKAFTVAAFFDFVIDQRKQYAGEISPLDHPRRKTQAEEILISAPPYLPPENTLTPV